MTNSPSVSIQRLPTSRYFAFLVGALSAALASLFVVAHWSAAVLGGLLILVLSALESEPFLLLVLFLLQVGWLLKGNNVQVHDVMTSARGLLVVGFFVGRFLRGELGISRFLRSSVSRWSLAFGGAALLSVMLGTGGWTHNSARSLALIASSLCFYLVMLVWVDSHQRMRRVLQVLLCSAIFTAGFAILQTIVGGYTSLWLYLYPPDEKLAQWDWRVTSFLNYPNTLAGYLNLILPFALACYALGAGKWRKLGGWAVALGFVALAMTQSRAGLVAFGCVLVCAVFLFIESWRRRLLLLGGLAVFIAGFYLVGRILSPARLGEIDVAEALSRPILWVTAWNLFLRSPLCGIGIGNFTLLHGPYIQISWIPTDYLTVNNLYFEVLSETGIIGFIVFFGLVTVAIRSGYRTFISATTALGKALWFGVFGAMVTILVHGTLDLTLDVSPQFDTLFWMMLALLVVYIRLQSRPLAAPGSFSILSTDRI